MSSAFSSTQEENKQNCVAKSKFCTYNPRPHIQHAFPHTQLVSLFRYLTRSPFTRGLGKIRFLRDGRAATARVGALDPEKDGRAVTRPELLSMLSAAAECCPNLAAKKTRAATCFGGRSDEKINRRSGVTIVVIPHVQ